MEPSSPSLEGLDPAINHLQRTRDGIAYSLDRFSPLPDGPCDGCGAISGILRYAPKTEVRREFGPKILRGAGSTLFRQSRPCAAALAVHFGGLLRHSDGRPNESRMSWRRWGRQ